MNNSLLLSAKNKYFGWQLNLGQNYRKRRGLLFKTGKWHEFLLSNGCGSYREK
jgi:hypothetical protein